MKTSIDPFQELLEVTTPLYKENRDLRELVTKSLSIADYDEVIQMLNQVQYEQYHESERQYHMEMKKYDC